MTRKGRNIHMETAQGEHYCTDCKQRHGAIVWYYRQTP